MDSQARTKDFDLTALLAPINPEDFFRDYWERKPLHLSRKDPHYYDTVLNNGDLESIISYPDLRRVPPLYPLTRAHEVDSATRWGRHKPIPF